ncbi:MAG: DUF2062 domain-containing protein [Terracidiphilus sp.]|jgi:uncharacterized protein (DUF2062 family)
MTLSPLRVPAKLRESVDSIRQSVALWLQQGLSPRRLALTLALGFAIGCIPLVGIPTVVCAALALALGLNQPAIQAANYAVMPLQLLLIVPFVRLGGWLVAARPTQAFQAATLLQVPTMRLLTQMGWIAGQALLAWVVLAVPAVLLLTFTLTLLLRRIPSLAAAEAGD